MTVQKINSSISQSPFRSLISMKKKIFIAFLVALSTGVSFAFYLYNKPHESIASDKAAFTLDAKILVGDYDSDENKANAKYLGKIIEVSGVISEKVKDKKGNFNITLQGPDLSGVGCEFEPKSQSTLAGLREGQVVKIKGICTGVLMDVVMVDCVCINE